MSGPAAREPAAGDTIGRNALFAFAAQLGSAAFTAGLTVFLVRELGPAGFGTLSLALGFTGILLRPSAAGTAQAVGRFVAERHGDTESIVGVLGMALRWRLLTAAAISLALVALAEPISDLYGVPEMVWPLRGVAIAFFGQSLLLFARTIFVSLRHAASGFTVVILESAMEFTATVALVLLAGGATAAAFGRAVGYLFGAVLAVVLLARFIGRSPLFGTGPSPVGRREFVNYTSAMLVVSGSSAVFSQLDVLLIGAFLSTAAVGVYAAPLRLIAFVGYPGYALAQGIGPRMARHPDQPQNLAALERAIRYILIVQAGLVAFLTAWAQPIVELALGADFSESAEVLRALAPYVFLGGLGSVLVLPLNYAGEARRRIPLAIVSVVVCAAIDVILIPEIGILGAAVGTDVGYALYVIGHLLLCRRLLGLALGPVWRSALRAAIAGVAMAAVLVAVGTVSLTALEWIAGLAAASAAFLAALLLTRELSITELRALVRLPLRALRRSG